MIHTIDLHFLDTPHSIAAFAVADDAGYTLVECGPYSTHDRLIGGLKELGIEPEQVHTLLLSHIHFDHAGAAWWWAERGTQVYVHPRGLKHMIDPTRLYGSAKQIYGDRMEELWGEMKGIDPARISAVEDRKELQIGGKQWTAHHTPGHASHHIAWQIGDVVFTGDVGGCRIEDGPAIPPCPPPDIDAEQWHESIERLRELNAGTFYLTHFGEVTDTEDHLDDLESRLDEYVAWMMPYAQRGMSAEAIVPKFEAFVEEDLVDNGVAERDLPAYAAANPAYMSVAGLLRYLNK
ncbi:glyoxylase-like metal-dependent hydrolase (beta-lactamase superfamily II) [Lewinella aquimaris]|uniref:Glyoxylase-like metal-dependent hydrolase (Beta-lactamase superfamily II) n=1 Tax=Neolewinella aquimaris TaxID=1835722 RepID=A0A840E282_9BACT|nr:MBL fold metallo-hydrolase [Neolewinella aquimaris]MBB4078063.1 glyoxylase-like metal-dependent hydrolase (beta-lactamase superfamily II) [Neolewinella aquimaris]